MFRFVFILAVVLYMFWVSVQQAFAIGENCSAPIEVTTCVDNSFHTYSTASMGNDYTRNYYGAPLMGNDIVFKVTPAPGIERILLSMKNVSAPLTFYSSSSPCPTQLFGGWSMAVGAVISNLGLWVSGTNPVYIVIDHNNAMDVSFEISFGGLGGYSYQSTPDTRGTLGLSSNCATPVTKSSLNVKWNGVQQYLPMTWTPLNSVGTITLTAYIQNPTGTEGIKSVEFTFDAGLVNPLPVATQVPGFYNTGNWDATQTGNKITYRFTDAAGIGRGDFAGTSQRCLAYTFSFTFTPTTHSPTNTNINLFFRGDDYKRSVTTSGYAFGCNAGGIPTSLLGLTSSSGFGTGSGFGIGINDPPLPVTLISFTATHRMHGVALAWTTAQEIDNHYFAVERSMDGVLFDSIGVVTALGPGSTYHFEDSPANIGDQYYRLKQVDLDGSADYSKVVSLSSSEQVNIYPVPASEVIYVSTPGNVRGISVVDATGHVVLTAGPEQQGALLYQFDISTLPEGIYGLLLMADELLIKRTFVKK